MKRLAIFAACLAVGLSAPGAQFAYDVRTPLAIDSFRTGVEAYNRGRFAESILSLERALSATPDDPLCLFWLGKAYYRLGLSTTAQDRWRDAIAAGGGSSFAESRIELAGAMASFGDGAEPEAYVRMDEFTGVSGKDTFFLRPTWIEPLPDGSVYLVSHGTDVILQISPNGQIVRRLNAGSTGFDRPYACAILDDGTMFVTEFQSDRVARLSPDGRVLGYSGDPKGPGRLAGPQSICADADGFVYVVDVGFRRVVKYARDGSFVLSFGTPSALFGGFKIPTGIAASGGRVYVADSVLKSIFAFDSYGNYIGKVETVPLVRPEGLRTMADGRLLLADGSRILSIDPETGDARSLYSSERKKPYLIASSFDVNGELLVADFDASELAYLSNPATRFTGLSVEVIRVYADSFPSVAVDVRVLDRTGKPIVGLDVGNFYIAEGVVSKERRTEGDKPVDVLSSSIRPVGGFSFEGALDRSGKLDVAFLLEASPAVSRTEARDALADLYGRLGPDASARLIVAGDSPQPAVSGGLKAMTAAALAMRPARSWRFDTGVRLAADSLFAAGGRRALVYLGSGDLSSNPFDGSSLAELASLLVNNGIVFQAVLLGGGEASDALSYLASRTGGSVVRAARPEGLSSVIEEARRAATGEYRLSFTSSADDGFGAAYLPLYIEAYLRDRSGREETGFFAPLR